GVGLGAAALVGLERLDLTRVTFAAPSLSPRTIVAGLTIGVTVTVLSALLPARAATRIAPVAALRTDLEPGSGRFRLGKLRTALTAVLAGLGLTIGVSGSVGMEKGTSAMYMVAAAGGVCFLAVIAAMPALVRPLGRLAGAIPARLGGVPGRLAVANAQRAPRRTATTTIALTIGVGLMSLFAVIAASGKATAEQQLEHQFPADFQVQAQDWESTVPHELAEALRKRPEIGTVVENRLVDAKTGDDEVRVSTYTASALGTIVKPDLRAGSLNDLRRPGTVMVDGTSADRQGYRVGQSVRFQTPNGPATAKIVAVYSPGMEMAGFIIPEADFTRYFGTVEPSRIAIKARDGVSAAAARAAV